MVSCTSLEVAPQYYFFHLDPNAMVGALNRHKQIEVSRKTYIMDILLWINSRTTALPFPPSPSQHDLKDPDLASAVWISNEELIQAAFLPSRRLVSQPIRPVR
mmetsp:Transcript_8354/g.18061  ORF Transcript_8354/g.18061 Transcript_8354/m.18061 type:complete len:103 (+) Transcript_8354:2-310(+)